VKIDKLSRDYCRF